MLYGGKGVWLPVACERKQKWPWLLESGCDWCQQYSGWKARQKSVLSPDRGGQLATRGGGGVKCAFSLMVVKCRRRGTSQGDSWIRWADVSGGSSSLWGNAEMTCRLWKVSASLRHCFYCTESNGVRTELQGHLYLGRKMKGNDGGTGQGQRREILRVGSRRCVEEDSDRQHSAEAV